MSISKNNNNTKDKIITKTTTTMASIAKNNTSTATKKSKTTNTKKIKATTKTKKTTTTKNKSKAQDKNKNKLQKRNIPLMPKATAVWLIENTGLTFEHIANFCNMHILEVQAIADGEIMNGVLGVDPIKNGQLTEEMINECVADKTKKLRLCANIKEEHIATQLHKKKENTSIKRQDKPNAIAWLLENYLEMTDNQIIKLIGTTKTTIDAVRNKTHWNIENIKPSNPILLGLCNKDEFEQLSFKIKVAAERISKLKQITPKTPTAKDLDLQH